MSKRPLTRLRGNCLAPTDPGLLGNPLEFIAEDHLRERQICALIDNICGADTPDPMDIETVLTFLGDEFAAHIDDEKDDLFPMMKRRCSADDGIEHVIEGLNADHATAAGLAPRIKAALLASLDGTHPLDSDDRQAMQEFATHARRHLIVENAIVLPIARAQLTKQDLESLSLRMLKRRGLDRLPEGRNAE